MWHYKQSARNRGNGTQARFIPPHDHELSSVARSNIMDTMNDEEDAGTADLGHAVSALALVGTMLSQSPRSSHRWEYNNARARWQQYKWVPFNSDFQRLIDNAYKGYNESMPKDSDSDFFHFNIPSRGGSQPYRINFRCMKQTNLRTLYERDVRYAEHLHEGFLYEVQYQYEDTLDLHFVLQLRREYPSATTYSPEEEDLVLEPLGDGEKEPVFAIGACDAPGKRPCYFRRSVISQTFENGCDPVCPTCNLRFTLPGPQPTGLMIVHINTTDPCAGYEQHDTIVISYEFMSGYQGARMDSPGTPYSGTLRAAFLPDTPEGRRALRLLVKAFKQGFLFRVGTSITTRRADTVVWGGIHQKTSLTGGVVDHGWPDDTYFDRLTSECMAHGITDDELVDSYGQP